MKRKICIVMAVMFVFVAAFSLFGCGGPKTYEINWNVDPSKGKIDLKTLFPSSTLTDSQFDNQNSYPVKTAQEITGYKVTYHQLPNNAAESALTSIYMNKTKYHMMKLTEGQLALKAREGAVLDLTDALTKWGPDILANIPAEAMEAGMYNGRIYAIPEIPATQGLNYALVFNMEHMRQVGRQLPTTLAEFTATLKALNGYYGGGQYAPLSFAGNTVILNQIATCFDMPDDVGIWYADESDNSIHHYAEHPGTKAYLEYMADLNSQSLIDTAFISSMSDQIRTKFANQYISVTYMPYWMIQPLRDQMQQKGMNPEDLGIVTHLKKDANTPAKTRSTAAPYYFLTVPYYMASEVGYVIDWINEKMKDKNWVKLTKGVEGVHYTDEGDGNYTINSAKLSEIEFCDKYLTGNNVELAREYGDLGFQVYKNTWQVIQDPADCIGSPIPYHPIIPLYGELFQSIMSNVIQDYQLAISKSDAVAKFDLAKGRWVNGRGVEINAELTEWYRAKLAA